MKAKLRRQFDPATAQAKRVPAALLPRILVAEDDSEIRDLDTKLLLRSGFQVDTVEDGAAAWEALQTHRYDLLITDNQMPKLSGVELLRNLRAARMALPVILVSGAMPTVELSRLAPMQIQATLLKPYTCEQFMETVKQVLHATGGNREPMPHPPAWQSSPSADRLQV